MQKQYTYLALGDSYTIGEALPLHESFPYQTVQALRKSGYDVAAPEIIAKTGWTTDELQHAIAEYTFAPKYDFVSLLIGVNNQYRNQDIAVYKDQFEALVKKSLELTGGKKDHLFVLSIPDYGITPFAQDKEPEKVSKEIDEYNKLKMALCIQYKLTFIEITDEFRVAKTDPTLLAEDGLHPSAQGYAPWAKKLAEAMEKLLKK